MSTRLYVGNLDYAVDDAKLYEVFSAVGEVRSAQVMVDRETGTSKGFGFVEMESPADAQRGIEQINGADVEGRTVTVNEARPKGESAGAENDLSPWLRNMLAKKGRGADEGLRVERDGYVSGHVRRRNKRKDARAR